MFWNKDIPRDIASRQNCLPLGPPFFAGRRGELEAVAERLEHRALVVVTGPGGLGKTALISHFIEERHGERFDTTLYLKCQSEWSGQDLALELLQALDRSLGEAREDWSGALQDSRWLMPAVVDGMERGDRWIVLDDAHLLDPGALESLCGVVLHQCRRAKLLVATRSDSLEGDLLPYQVPLGLLTSQELVSLSEQVRPAWDPWARERAIGLSAGSPFLLFQMMCQGGTPEQGMARMLQLPEGLAPGTEALLAAMAWIDVPLGPEALERLPGTYDPAEFGRLRVHGLVSHISGGWVIHDMARRALLSRQELGQSLAVAEVLLAMPDPVSCLEGLRLAVQGGEVEAGLRMLDSRGDGLLADSRGVQLSRVLRGCDDPNLQGWRLKALLNTGDIDLEEGVYLPSDAPGELQLRWAHLMLLSGREGEALKVADALQRGDFTEDIQTQGWLIQLLYGTYANLEADWRALFKARPTPKAEPFRSWYKLAFIVVGRFYGAPDLGDNVPEELAGLSFEGLPEQMQHALRRAQIHMTLVYDRRRALAMADAYRQGLRCTALASVGERHLIEAIAAADAGVGRIPQARAALERLMGVGAWGRDALGFVKWNLALLRAEMGEHELLERLVNREGDLGIQELVSYRYATRFARIGDWRSDGVEQGLGVVESFRSARDLLQWCLLVRRGEWVGREPPMSLSEVEELAEVNFKPGYVIYLLGVALNLCLAGDFEAATTMVRRAIKAKTSLSAHWDIEPYLIGADVAFICGDRASLHVHLGAIEARVAATGASYYGAEIRLHRLCQGDREFDPAVLHEIAEGLYRNPVSARRARGILGGAPALDSLDFQWIEACRGRALGEIAFIDSGARGWTQGDCRYRAALWIDALKGGLWMPEAGFLDFAGHGRLWLLLVTMAKSGGIANKETLVEATWGVEYHPLKHDPRLRQSILRLRRILGEHQPGGGGYLCKTEEGYGFAEGVYLRT